MRLRNVIRSVVPHGLVEARRRKYLMRQWNLPSTPRHRQAVTECRYALWPRWLRTADNWTLADVGANDGNFIRAVRTLSNPATVYAFEPQVEFRASILSSLEGVNNGRLFDSAVGNAAGRIEFKVTKNRKLASALTPASAASRNYECGDFDVVTRAEVPVITLDRALDTVGTIDLLKVDVQGYEREVFGGARAVLARTRALLLEVNYVQHYEGAPTFDEVYTIVRDAGFSLSGVSEPYASFASGPLWSDAMFERSGSVTP